MSQDFFARITDVDAVGVASIADMSGTPLDDGAASLLPGACSIVVLATEIFPEVVGLVESEGQKGEAAARDLYGPHLDYLQGRLNRGIYELARHFKRYGYRALPLPSLGAPVDARFQRGILSYKHAAEFAGIGRFGRSSLLVSPAFGPQMRLACVLTDAEIPASQPLASNPCSGCGTCIKNCPSQALSTPANGEPYAMNKYACASFRSGSGGCVACMASCPVGRG